jgi:hypothetical protein
MVTKLGLTKLMQPNSAADYIEQSVPILQPERILASSCVAGADL